MTSNAGNNSERAELCRRLRLWADNAKEQDATEVTAGLREAAVEIEYLADELVRLYTQRKKLLAERDDARREVCEWVAMMTKRKPSTAAKYRGWDCFKENTHEH